MDSFIAIPPPNAVYTDPLLTLSIATCNPAILILTITADETLNAQDLTMLHAIHHVLYGVIPYLFIDPLPRVLILTAEGTRRFIGAAQPEMLMTANQALGMEISRLGQENAKALESGMGCNIVTIAAVNGAAIGGGLEMVLGCDFAVADVSARFRQAEVLGGMVPGFGASGRLSRSIGRNRARWMILTGQSIDAKRAKDWGLILEIVQPTFEAHGEKGVMAMALVLAEQICNAQEVAVRKTKEILVSAAKMSQDEADLVEREAFGSIMGTSELRLSMQALIKVRSFSTPPSR